MVEEIAEIGRLRAPNEALGVLLPTPYRDKWVWEMPNRSLTPQDQSLFVMEDMKVELSEWLNSATRDQVNGVIVWHTHPAGHVGPSASDMRQIVPGLTFLVVALTEDGPVPTLYTSLE